MTAPPPLPMPIWREIGRSSPGETPDWITWIALVGDTGDALYRLLVLADGAITISIGRCMGHSAETRTIHRGRCGLPRSPQETAERIRALLTAADEAAAGTLQADHDRERAVAGHGRSPRQASGRPRSRTQTDASPVWRAPEHHIRERAYFLWKQDGCPDGRAHEFWERACQEEARAASGSARADWPMDSRERERRPCL